MKEGDDKVASLVIFTMEELDDFVENFFFVFVFLGGLV